MQTNSIALISVSSVIGYILGYISRGLIDKYAGRRELNYRIFVVVIVSFAFLISFINELFNPAYHTNPLLYGLMTGIVGFLFKNNDKKSNS